jgi:hypothetical protein
MEIKSGDRFDKRLIERRMRKGEVPREEYEAHLSSLADMASNAEPIESKVEPVLEEGAEEESGDE